MRLVELRTIRLSDWPSLGWVELVTDEGIVENADRLGRVVHHHERRQVGVLGAEAIRHPRPQARPAREDA